MEGEPPRAPKAGGRPGRTRHPARRTEPRPREGGPIGCAATPCPTAPSSGRETPPAERLAEFVQPGLAALRRSAEDVPIPVTTRPRPRPRRRRRPRFRRAGGPGPRRGAARRAGRRSRRPPGGERRRAPGEERLVLENGHDVPLGRPSGAGAGRARRRSPSRARFRTAPRRARRERARPRRRAAGTTGGPENGSAGEGRPGASDSRPRFLLRGLVRRVVVRKRGARLLVGIHEHLFGGLPPPAARRVACEVGRDHDEAALDRDVSVGERDRPFDPDRLSNVPSGSPKKTATWNQSPLRPFPRRPGRNRGGRRRRRRRA